MDHNKTEEAVTEDASGIVHQADITNKDKVMAEATSGIVHHADVAVFRAVHCIPFARLKYIMCTHYGANNFDTEWQRVRGDGRLSVSGNKNLYLYLSITNRLDRKEGAIRDIMAVYRDITTTESECKDRVETLAEDRTPPLVERVDPCTFDNTMIEAAESVMGLEEPEYMTEYLDTFKCNTTRSCFLELGEMTSYGCEDYSDEEWEHEELDRRLNNQDLRSMSEPAQGEVDQDSKGGYKAILEDLTVEKPKAVIDQD